jgi:aminomethyltransferase
MTVFAGDRPLGRITSGTFSPTLRTGIALALLDTVDEVARDAAVEVDLRGRRLPGVVTVPPFVPSRVR